LLTGHGCALLTGAAQGVESVSNATSCLEISGMIKTFAFKVCLPHFDDDMDSATIYTGDCLLEKRCNFLSRQPYW
jgi:hypothetical protein